MVEKVGALIKLPYWTSREQTLAYSRHLAREFLVKLPLKTKESRKDGHASNRNLEGTGADSPCVPKDEPMRKMSSLNGQGAFEGPKEKTKVVSPSVGGSGTTGNA